MTEESQTPPYDPDAEYDLTVTRPVEVKSAKFLPRHQIQASGKILNAIVERYGADAIRSAEPR